MAQEGEHDYYGFNEAMVQGVYENVKHCIKVFNNKEPLD
jgi:fructose-bisphosphate aldolase class II